MRLIEAFSTWRALDGTPTVGEPLRTLDYSEVSVHFSFAPEAILRAPLRDVLAGRAPHRLLPAD